MAQLRVTLLQTDIVWKNKEMNLCHLRKNLKSLCGLTEIVILPEMFTTGFSMDSDELAETTKGITVETLKQLAHENKTALCGSFICADSGKYYNRGFFITPDGKEYYYDKHHLFRMGSEQNHFTAGQKQLIIPYNDWNICLLVCYDLRFPVWSRNVNNCYDLLIYVANWPKPRRNVWDALLTARAIENQAYVCGVNRVGIDGYGLNYDGGSAIYSAKGKILAKVDDGQEGCVTATIDLNNLTAFREKFPVWMDSDSFTITD